MNYSQKLNNIGLIFAGEWATIYQVEHMVRWLFIEMPFHRTAFSSNRIFIKPSQRWLIHQMNELLHTMKWQWLFTFWLIHRKYHKTIPIKPAAHQSKQKCSRPSGLRVMADQSFLNPPCLEAGLASVGDPRLWHRYPHPTALH
jgi:hypothetical protein